MFDADNTFAAEEALVMTAKDWTQAKQRASNWAGGAGTCS